MQRLSLSCFAALLAVACSSGDSKNDGGGGTDSGGTDSGGKSDGSSTMDSSMMMDTSAADAGLHGCATFEDRSGPMSMRTITWDFNPTPKCIEIAAGQTVTWQGDFAFHPLEAFGGTMPSPIMVTASGMSAMTTFPNAGFYGYRCAVHSGLEGVIHVK